MSRLPKFLIGLAAVLVMGWVSHGPLGQGARLVNGLEAQAKAQVAGTGVEGVRVQLGRDPLSRVATLSGPANNFQREGQGSLPGINDLVGGIEGIGAVRWSNPPTA